MSFLTNVEDVLNEAQIKSTTVETPIVKNYSTELFNKLLTNAKNNCSSLPTGRRHNEIIKKFSLSLWLMVGPSAYKLVHANMPEALPSLSTVERDAKKRYTVPSEGEFQFDKLVAHLEAYNAERIVTISEDATRVVTRVEYDDTSDKIVGFVLPLDDNGLPMKDYFGATSLDDIEQMFRSSKKASNAYIYMVQAMSPNVPPFCLALVGTDNCFDANTVLLRWKYVVKECNLRRVQVISFSADGDSRLLTSMRLSLKLHNYLPKQYQRYLITNESFPQCQPLVIPPTWSSWFSAKNIVNSTFVQDTVHLGVKLKARLLTYSQILPMGNYCAQSSHLSLVQASFCKEQHNLRIKDLDHQDRQNFEAVLRITSKNVLCLLDEFPDAKGTKIYLEVVSSIIGSFLNKELKPLDRIKEAWFALFFVRYWRQWILSHKDYTLERNFISLNSYICIELNAHALLILLLILRDTYTSECFFPWLLGSQPCERAFRAARSMSPTFSTVINFTVLGLIRRLHKLQIEVDLESEADSTGIIYPHQQAHKSRSGINEPNLHSVSNITNEQIEEVVKCSLEKAKTTLDELGMKELLVKAEKWEEVLGDSSDVKVETENDDDSYDDEISPAINDSVPSSIASEIDHQVCKDVVESLVCLEEKNVIDKKVKERITYLCRNETVDSDGKTTIPVYKLISQNDESAANKKSKQSSKYIEINHGGEKIFVRKSTLVWLYQEGERVSSDRLFRVRVKQPYSTSVQQISSNHNTLILPQVQECIELGDLCAFQDSGERGWSIGRVTQFSKYKERLKSDRQFKGSKALVDSNVGVLCTWFESSKDDCLKFQYTSTRPIEYVPISQSYICTLTHGCFLEKTGTTISSTAIRSVPDVAAVHTASHFSVRQEAFDYIDAVFTGLTTTSSKVNCLDSSRKNHNEVEQWISYGRISLNSTDKRLLETGKCLTDKHINSSCGLLKRQFPLYGGFQLTLLQNKIPLASHNVIQVIYLENQKHWAVISTVDCEQNTVHYFDSINSSVSMEAQHIIVKLLRPKDTLLVKVKNVCKQTGAADCGLYAIAFCTSIVHKQNPCSVVYSQQEMRIHLKMCLEQKILSQFPTLKTRRLITEDVLTVTVELCPVCMLPDDGELMVYCEACKRWFHKTCVAEFDEGDKSSNWLCANCKC